MQYPFRFKRGKLFGTAIQKAIQYPFRLMRSSAEVKFVGTVILKAIKYSFRFKRSLGFKRDQMI